MCDWSDSDQVMKDCEKLIKAANDEIHKDTDKIDEHLAYESLLQIRQRLAQASDSYRSKWCINLLILWQLSILGVCAFLIVYFRLLPDQTPRVASSSVNVTILFSSAVFGAIGGLFDGLSFMSKQSGNRQFDKGNWLWYLTNSFLGAVLGVVIFALILAGILVTTGTGIPAKSETEVTAPTARAALVLAIAFLAGFKQIAAISYLEGIANSFFKKSDKDDTSQSS